MEDIKPLTAKQAEEQGAIAITLEADGPMSANRLADELARELGAVIADLKELEEQGFVEHDGDDPDSGDCDWDITDREEDSEFA